MGFRFRKSFKIAPGIRINASLGGLSTTVGRRGASINIGKRGVRGTVGVPGTGVSYTSNLSGPQSSRRADRVRSGASRSDFDSGQFEHTGWIRGERVKVIGVVIVVTAIALAVC